MRGVSRVQFVADKWSRQPAEPFVAKDFLDAADPRSLAGQGREELDIAAGHQRRPCGVAAEAIDREGDALERLWQAPFGASQVFGDFTDKGAGSVRRARGRQIGEPTKEIGEPTVGGLWLLRDHAVEGSGDIPGAVARQVARQDDQAQPRRIFGPQRREAIYSLIVSWWP